jgi:Ala-tRNA(Pro) deacylase
MAVSPMIQEFLRRADVAYSVVPHARAFSAAEEAAVTAVPKRNWAKVVICFADGEPVQAVVPADCYVDLALLAGVTAASTTRLASEDELEWLYPDCEPGAMPPLGPLYRQLVFVDAMLAVEDEIVFNAGSYGDAISMRFADFEAIAHPVIARFSRPRNH